jgi:hypothetical protein
MTSGVDGYSEQTHHLLEISRFEVASDSDFDGFGGSKGGLN